MATTPKDNKNEVTRRAFIRTAAAGAATVGAAKATADVYKSILPAAVLGANEKIRTGHIGTGGMGRANLGYVLQRDDMQPVAVCDIWPKNLERGAGMVKQKFSDAEPQKYTDFRKLLENKDVDAVVIATPDHWHCLCTLYAAEAKKAIYCEKPLCTMIEEGKAMVEAVRRNKVVFQGGTMQRSGTHFQEAVELVRSGYIGQVAHVETFNHEDKKIEGIGKGETDISKFPDVNEDVWNFYQGWVEHQPFNINRWIYNFRWFLDYSGGKITDWGAHLIDIGVWAMGEEKQPKAVCATGGKYVLTDDRTTPDTLDVVWQFDDFIITFTNRVYNQFLPSKDFSDHGILFHGTLGTLRVDRGGYQVYPVPNNGGCAEKKSGPSPLNEPHWQNFADCVRSGKDPIVTVETLHNTTRLCHMGTCSYVADAKLHWDAKEEKFVGDCEATKKGNEWAARKYNNGWSLKSPFFKA
jgi:predicted dehydrogenase